MSLNRSTRTRTKVQCFCNKCNSALVDLRTKKRHMSKRINYQEARPFRLPDEMDDIEMDDNEIKINYQEVGLFRLPDEMGDIEMNDDETDDNAMEYPLHIFLTKKLPINESAKSQFVKKGKISDRVLENLLSDDSDDVDDADVDDQNINSDEEEDFENDDYEEINFALSDFDDDELKLPNTTNDNYTWIILWLLEYKQRYKLSNIAMDSLFKFLSLFLSTIDENKFSSFPSTLYMAKKDLGIPTKIIQYAACNKCHKLYSINELLDKLEVQTCSFVNYSNHTIERF